MTDQEMKEALNALRGAEDRVMAYALKEKRELTEEEKRLLGDIYAETHRLNLGIPAAEKPERLTVIGPHSGGSLHKSSSSLLDPRSFRAMFYPEQAGAALDRGGFASAAEFIRVIDSGRYDPRLVRAAAQEMIPSTGGFSVPVDFAAEWLDASLPNEVIRRLCRVFPMTSETKQVPGWDGADMSTGATFGGFTMEFLAEGSDGTKQTPKMRQIELHAKMGAIYVDASIELIQDGRNFAENLQSALVKSVGYGIDRFCIAGTGAGEPLGLLSLQNRSHERDWSTRRHDSVWQHQKNVCTAAQPAKRGLVGELQHKAGTPGAIRGGRHGGELRSPTERIKRKVHHLRKAGLFPSGHACAWRCRRYRLCGPVLLRPGAPAGRLA